MTKSRPKITRRRLLTGGLAASGLALTSGCQTGGGSNGQHANDAGSGAGGLIGSVVKSDIDLPQHFQLPFVVPPIKEVTRNKDGYDRAAITQREAEVEILPGTRTPIFGYDGHFPGPTIHSRSGRGLDVVHTNQLGVPTVVHLHGGHTPSSSDGFPTDLIIPSKGHQHEDRHSNGKSTVGSRTYHYPMDQRAATLWYHDHRMDFTAQQVWRGLAGFHLVSDDDEEALGLPDGEYDVPIMIADRSFNADGAFKYPSLDPSLRDKPGVEKKFMDGVLGDVILVNGVPWPDFEVAPRRHRLRLLNASNARVYRLRLTAANGANYRWHQIGSDGGLLQRPVERNAVTVAPAERVELLVDFAAAGKGAELTLLNDFGKGTTRDIMRFRVTKSASDDSRMPHVLSKIETLDPKRAVRTRNWSFSRGSVNGKNGWTINGKPFDPDSSFANVRLGDTEIWRFHTDTVHPVHLHLGMFQVLSRASGSPGPDDLGWKDTIGLRTQQAEVAIRFTEYTGKYLIHCHNLEHEDMAMMARFDTVK